jgi:hypothetical protein
VCRPRAGEPGGFAVDLCGGGVVGRGWGIPWGGRQA